MNKKDIKFILAPIGVAAGIALWVFSSIFVSQKLGIGGLTEIFKNIPSALFFFLGAIFIAVWLPVFISGIYFLGRRGAVGQTDVLIENGIYKYVRNPMYSGISFTMIGIGLIINETGVILAGVIWLVICFIQCKREEKDLEARFKEKYVDYKSRTSMFIPNIKLAMRDLLDKRNKQNSR